MAMPRAANYLVNSGCLCAWGKLGAAPRDDETANSSSRMFCLLLARALCVAKNRIKIVISWSLIRLSKRLPVRFQPCTHATFDVPDMLVNDRSNFGATQWRKSWTPLRHLCLTGSSL